jgi:hypothetical protein
VRSRALMARATAFYGLAELGQHIHLQRDRHGAQDVRAAALPRLDQTVVGE